PRRLPSFPTRRSSDLTVVAVLFMAVGLQAQSDTASRTDSTRTDSAKVADTTARTAAPVGVPFPVGERLVYGARYGPFSVGTATMQVAGIDTKRAVSRPVDQPLAHR